jgi:hypothetical protein
MQAAHFHFCRRAPLSMLKIKFSPFSLAKLIGQRPVAQASKLLLSAAVRRNPRWQRADTRWINNGGPVGRKHRIGVERRIGFRPTGSGRSALGGGTRATSSCVPSAPVRQTSAGCYGRAVRVVPRHEEVGRAASCSGLVLVLDSGAHGRPEQEVLSKRIGKMPVLS